MAGQGQRAGGRGEDLGTLMYEDVGERTVFTYEQSETAKSRYGEAFFAHQQSIHTQVHTCGWLMFLKTNNMSALSLSACVGLTLTCSLQVFCCNPVKVAVPGEK